MPPPRLRNGILSTDAYQLTMAQLYFRLGLHERTVRFEHFFRSYPDYGDHQAGYCVAAGLAPFVEWVTTTRATPVDVEALRGHRSRSGERLFGDDFCTWFASAGFDGLALERGAGGPGRPPEHADHRRRGAARRRPAARDAAAQPAQLLDAHRHQGRSSGRGRPGPAGARVRHAPGRGVWCGRGVAGGDRRRRGRRRRTPPSATSSASPQRARTPTRWCSCSSPWVEGEQAAFDAYADVYPDDTLLLVDTVDTLESGIPNAIATFERLRRAGHEPVGIRLDSGDLAYLAVQAARELDGAGFPDAVIVLSSQLDELTIWQIVSQIGNEARRSGVEPDAVIGRLVFGVGSRLATSDGDSSLDGVFKLVAVEEGGAWLPSMKRSDSPAKVLNPGRKRLWRVYDDRQRASADVLSTVDETVAPAPTCTSTTTPAPTCPARSPPSGGAGPTSCWSRCSTATDWSTRAERTASATSTAAAKRRNDDVEALDPGVRRLVRPHTYHVSITASVFDLKRRLLADLE